jgi:hypothetical protein
VVVVVVVVVVVKVKVKMIPLKFYLAASETAACSFILFYFFISPPKTEPRHPPDQNQMMTDPLQRPQCCLYQAVTRPSHLAAAWRDCNR